jgi:hypothetical protein
MGEVLAQGALSANRDGVEVVLLLVGDYLFYRHDMRKAAKAAGATSLDGTGT